MPTSNERNMLSSNEALKELMQASRDMALLMAPLTCLIPHMFMVHQNIFLHP